MLTRGYGGLKHITVKSLWVQEVVPDHSIENERILAGRDAVSHPCLSIQCGTVKKAPDRVERLS